MGNDGSRKNNDKSLESWIWDAACSIRGAKEAKATDAALKEILKRIGI